jgi:long-chain fatty acid transport protein
MYLTAAPAQLRRLLTAGLLAGLAPLAHGAGFALIEQSASGQGNAYAGGSAIAEDATTVYFNPAGMTRLHGTHTLLAGHVIITGADFDNQGSVLNPALGDVPLPGDSDKGGQSGYVPNLYLVTEVGERWRLGLGIGSLFGLKTDYDDDWVGRYHALHSHLTTVNFNPSVAYKLNDMWSLGAGIDIQYADAKLSNAIDFGTVCVGQLGPQVCNALGVQPTTADGRLKIGGDDWGYGFNLGLLFQPLPSTRFGLAYRSKVALSLKGHANFRVPEQAAFLTATGAFTNTDVKAAVDLPETVSISAVHEINPQWTLMGDVTWTRWSRFDEIVFRFDNPAQPTSSQPEDWNDSTRYSLGLNWRPTGAWTLRTGVAYDETPVPGSRERTARIPDNDRTWLSFGLGYRFSPRLSFDLGYSHLFIDDASIDNTEVSTGHVLKGKYDLNVDVVSAQVEWRMP